MRIRPGGPATSAIVRLSGAIAGSNSSPGSEVSWVSRPITMEGGFLIASMMYQAATIAASASSAKATYVRRPDFAPSALRRGKPRHSHHHV